MSSKSTKLSVADLRKIIREVVEEDASYGAAFKAEVLGLGPIAVFKITWGRIT